MSDKHIPQTFYFKVDQQGIPRRIVEPKEEPSNGFWATVIKRFPEIEPEEPKNNFCDRLWLLRRENDSYMVLYEQGSGADVHTEAVLFFSSAAYSNSYFRMMKDRLVLPRLLHIRVTSAYPENDPEGSEGHWKRVRRIIRDDLEKCRDEELPFVAATLGSNLSPERLKLRPKHAPRLSQST